MSQIPKVSDTFTNIYGKHFDKVREIAFYKNELLGNVGKFITESQDNISDNGSEITNTGVYIYQSITNPTIGYRIYKAYAEYQFNGYLDDLLIQKLAERNGKIHQQFPTGVVTLDGRIIGQEIIYFPNTITLLEYVTKFSNINIISLYKHILKQLKEMYESGIMYLDVHPKNFMINPIDHSIYVIDFDYMLIRFDCDSTKIRKRMFDNFNEMVDYLNYIQKIDSKVSKTLPTDNFEDTFEQLTKMEKKLVIK